MFDIYSLAKPRVFFEAKPHDGGGSWNPGETDDTQEERYTSELVENEKDVLDTSVTIITAETAAGRGHPEAEGRVDAYADLEGKASKNVIDAFSDLGGIDLVVSNVPTTIVGGATKKYRTEFRPKQGLHNLDFTTPSETPSDNPGGDAPAQ